MKFSHFIPIRLQTWVPLAILNSNWLKFSKIFSSETIWPNGMQLGRKYLCKIFYKINSFRPNLTTNMAAIGNS